MSLRPLAEGPLLGSPNRRLDSSPPVVGGGVHLVQEPADDCRGRPDALLPVPERRHRRRSRTRPSRGAPRGPAEGLKASRSAAGLQAASPWLCASPFSGWSSLRCSSGLPLIKALTGWKQGRSSFLILAASPFWVCGVPGTPDTSKARIATLGHTAPAIPFCSRA